MVIRKAVIEDWKQISSLLDQLEYSNTESFIKEKLEVFLRDPNEVLLIFEENNQVTAFISMHFIPQLALKGDFARISYFAVDQHIRSKGLGHKIEEYCTNLAIEKKCDRIEVHCHSRRTDAHRFYMRQGYSDSPKYFIKMLV